MPEGIKVILWQDESGRLMIETPGGQKPVSPKTLLQDIQAACFIDLGGQQIKLTKSHDGKDDACPHCHSTNTIGHGGRGTLKEYQIRRMCNDCNRTFIAGKEPVQEKPEKKSVNIGQIRLLFLSGSTAQEIAEELGISLSSVNDQLNKLETELGMESHYITEQVTEFKKAKPFNKSLLIKDIIGNAIVWDFDGRLELGRRGIKETITVAKSDEKLMMKLAGKDLREFIKNLSDSERKIIIGYIDDKKDDMMGILPKTRTDTRIPVDGGEIDAETLVAGLENELTSSESEE